MHESDQSAETIGTRHGDFVLKGGRMLFQRVGGLNAPFQVSEAAPARRGIWAFPFPIFDWAYVGWNAYGWSLTHAPKDTRVHRLSAGERRALEKRLKGLVARQSVSISAARPSQRARVFDTKESVEAIRAILDAGEGNARQVHMVNKSRKVAINRIRKFWWGGPVWARFSARHFISDGGWFLHATPNDYVQALRRHAGETIPDEYGGFHRRHASWTFTWGLQVFLPTRRGTKRGADHGALRS